MTFKKKLKDLENLIYNNEETIKENLFSSALFAAVTIFSHTSIYSTSQLIYEIALKKEDSQEKKPDIRVFYSEHIPGITAGIYLGILCLENLCETYAENPYYLGIPAAFNIGDIYLHVKDYIKGRKEEKKR